MKQNFGKLAERNREMVEWLDSGNPSLTLAEVGGHYGLTRERVRQLYKKITGEAFGVNQNQIRFHAKQVAAEKKSNEIKFYCANCSKPVLRKDKCLRKYCRECRRLVVEKSFRFNRKLLKCFTCGKVFPPRGLQTYSGTRLDHCFCSRRCFHEALRSKTIKGARKYSLDKIKILENLFKKPLLRGDLTRTAKELGMPVDYVFQAHCKYLKELRINTRGPQQPVQVTSLTKEGKKELEKVRAKKGFDKFEKPKPKKEFIFWPWPKRRKAK